MNINKAFPSKHLKASDFDDVDTPCTIKRVAMEQISQDKDEAPKPIVYFAELDKGLVCNKTNASTIAKLYGDDTDRWTGQKIALWVNHEVQFMSDIVSAIRVRSRPPSSHAVDPILSAPVGQPVRQSKQQTQHVKDPQTLAFVLTIEGLDADEHVNKLMNDFGYANLEAVPVIERDQFIVFVQTLKKRAAVT